MGGVFAGAPVDDVSVRFGEGGAIYLRSTRVLKPPRKSIPHMFDETASRWPDRPFLKQRDAAGSWRSVSYGMARHQSRNIAQWLIDAGFSAGDTLAVLSGPSIEHGVLAIAAQRARVAAAPLSPAYSLLDKSLAKLRQCIDRLSAKAVFVDEAGIYEAAIRMIADMGIRVIAVNGAVEGVPLIAYADILKTAATPAVDAQTEAITDETIARIMHTSGSTGSPKAVPLPQANLTYTVAQCETVGLLDLGDEQPQFLEAMPFNHIMGGNYNFNNMISVGGAIHLDEGKPTPELFAKTLDNLREMSPHIYHTVPAGLAMLCDALENDRTLRDRFFKNLVYMGCGGAVLADSVVARLSVLSRAAVGREFPIYGFYGATEFSLGAVRYWSSSRMDVIGLPLPATELKLQPMNDKFELCVRSPTAIPNSGYLNDPDAARKLFDAEGYFHSGDAVFLDDAEHPSNGLVFSGRIADQFKLATGTWVSVGTLRLDLLEACAPLVKEVVICGINQSYVGVLIWLNEVAAKALTQAQDGVPSHAGLATYREIVKRLTADIERFNQKNTGGSRAIRAARVVDVPLSIEDAELTDKGSVSQRRVHETRADEVSKLFRSERDDGRTLTF